MTSSERNLMDSLKYAAIAAELGRRQREKQVTTVAEPQVIFVSPSQESVIFEPKDPVVDRRRFVQYRRNEQRQRNRERHHVLSKALEAALGCGCPQCWGRFRRVRDEVIGDNW